MSAHTSSTPATLHPSTSTSKNPPPANIKSNRLPAPTLFVGPPSRNASQISISRNATNEPTSRPPVREPLIRTKSALTRPFNPSNPHPTLVPEVAAAPTSKDTSDPHTFSKTSEKALERRWKEMQSTLNDVEITAQSSAHVFAAHHAAALDSLRHAQIELARAWGRSHDEGLPTGPAGESSDANPADASSTGGDEDLPGMPRRDLRPRAGTDASSSTMLSDESSRSETVGSSRGGHGGGLGGAGGAADRTRLEDETAQDIKLAGERRAVNEAYFRKVDNSVKHVVARLEAVAEAMRGVEGESRSLWSESADSLEDDARGERESAVG